MAPTAPIHKALPDYYAVLNVPPSASFQSILTAYQREALRLHPELHPPDGITQAAYNLTNEAYFVLSDASKRAKYDALRQKTNNGPSVTSELQQMLVKFMDSMNPTGSINGVFDEAFAPLLNQEIQAWEVEQTPPRSIWRTLGSFSGMILGLIIANVPGAAVGAALGYKLGLVRDTTGKAVIEVWHTMSGEQRRTILGRLARKILL